MQRPVRGVGGVGLVEAIDDARGACRTIHVERPGAACDPTLRDGLAQVADVIGVKVRE